MNDDQYLSRQGLVNSIALNEYFEKIYKDAPVREFATYEEFLPKHLYIITMKFNLPRLRWKTPSGVMNEFGRYYFNVARAAFGNNLRRKTYQQPLVIAYVDVAEAMQLGFLPRIDVRHTSAELLGQIYVPRVNWTLLVGVLLLVVIFRSSSALAHAYVLAVATANLMAVLLGFIVIWKVWKWPLGVAALLMVPFIVVDAIFVAATTLNIFEGAWLPVVVGGCIMAIMLTWMRGTRLLREKTRRIEVPIEPLVKSLERRLPPVVSGTAIFLTADPEHAPTSLMHNLKHNKVLHEQNVILTVITSNSPRVSDDDRVRIEGISPHFYRLVVTFGYMETPNIPKALAAARKLGWTFDIMSTSFFLSRRSLRPAPHSGMPKWQDRLFIRLAHAADDATSYFHIPTDRVVEVGMQVTI